MIAISEELFVACCDPSREIADSGFAAERMHSIIAAAVKRECDRGSMNMKRFTSGERIAIVLRRELVCSRRACLPRRPRNTK